MDLTILPIHAIKYKLLNLSVSNLQPKNLPVEHCIPPETGEARIMNCPYCGTENPDDAQECSNCSADLSSLFKGAPPPESYAPTMMTSSAEVASMLAAARGESSSDPETPAEPEEPAAPDYAAPTMMTSSAEVSAMLAEARGETPAEPEASEPLLEEVPMGEVPMDEVPVEEYAEMPAEEAPMEEVPMGEAPMDMPEPPALEEASPYAPTMISSMPAEVSEALAAAQAGKMAEEAPVEMEEMTETPAEPEEPAAPTFVGIPDPLGMSDAPPLSPAEPAPPHIPAYNEPVITPTPVAPSDASEPPKDNKNKWLIGGAIGCVVIMCCVCVVIPAVMFLINLSQVNP